MEIYQQNPQFQLAEKICKTLQEKGYEALLAGGCVRDFLLHRTPNDFDVATSALPEIVEQIFPKTIAVGKSFGVMVVVDGSEQVEVATFRKDGPYLDGRRPSSIEFSEAEEDSKRRDFTINGLFYDLSKREVLDYVEGLDDLKAQQIRAIGVPAQRFEEDHLRLLRAIRFASQLGFEIENGTWEAVEVQRSLIQSVSGERIQDELTKFLMGHFLDRGLELLFQSGLLASLLEQENLIWKPPFPVFTRKEKTAEDHWFRFFFWLRGVMMTGASLFFFEELCDRWKFSRDLKQKTLKALQWTFERKPFLNHPLGELLSFSYEPEHLRGLIEYSEFFLGDDEKSAFENFLSRRLALGREKPKPWIVAADLAPRLQGEQLGRALKQSYWEQLEGVVTDKSEILKKWSV
jgi:tRNA nucleotidyltransferase/poly(A) polymerase